jgi:hypothetical protein
VLPFRSAICCVLFILCGGTWSLGTQWRDLVPFRRHRNTGRLMCFHSQHLRQSNHSLLNKTSVQWLYTVLRTLWIYWLLCWELCCSSPCFCGVFQMSTTLYRFQGTFAMCSKSEWNDISKV